MITIVNFEPPRILRKELAELDRYPDYHVAPCGCIASKRYRQLLNACPTLVGIYWRGAEANRRAVEANGTPEAKALADLQYDVEDEIDAHDKARREALGF